MGLPSSCSVQPSHCNGFSCCRAQAPGCAVFSTCRVWAQELWFPALERRLQDVWSSALAEYGLNSCGSLLENTGSTGVAHGLSCPMACGIFPDKGLNPCFLHWQADSLPLSHQGSRNNFLKLFMVRFRKKKKNCSLP